MSRFHSEITIETYKPTEYDPAFNAGFAAGVQCAKERPLPTWDQIEERATGLAGKHTAGYSEDTWEDIWEQYVDGFYSGFYAQFDLEIPKAVDTLSFHYLLHHTLFNHLGIADSWMSSYCGVAVTAIQRYIQEASSFPVQLATLMHEEHLAGLVLAVRGEDDLYLSAKGFQTYDSLWDEYGDYYTIECHDQLYTPEAYPLDIVHASIDMSIIPGVVTHLTEILGPFQPSWVPESEAAWTSLREQERARN